MKLGETLELRIENIDLFGCAIFLDDDTTKERKDIVGFFSYEMQRLLQIWIKFKDVIQESELLFPTQRTNGKIEQGNLERNFRGYLAREKINKNITPYGLRNNFSRRFLLNGGSIFVLSKILGHSSVSVTEKAYLDLQDEDLRKKYMNYLRLETIRNK